MHREVILGKSCENKSSITEQTRGKGARGKDIQRPQAHDESCCINPSTEDASAGDVDDRVGLTVCKNCIVGLLLGEEGVRRDMKLLVLVVLLEMGASLLFCLMSSRAFPSLVALTSARMRRSLASLAASISGM